MKHGRTTTPAERRGLGPRHALATQGPRVLVANARRDAAATNTRTAHLLDSRPTWLPPLAPAVGWLLLGVPLLVAVAEPFLLAHGVHGRASGLRGTGFAVVIGLAGLVIATRPGRHLVAALAAGVAGLGLVLAGLLATHGRGAVGAFEVTVGLVAMVLASAATLRPQDSTSHQT